ncbi:MAG: hypothetical protein ABSA32_01785 [Candidatus Acidiferrales bacterium]|jgi:hypothetical protein
MRINTHLWATRHVPRIGHIVRTGGGARRIALSLALAMCLGAAGAARSQTPDAPESSNPPAPPPSDIQVTVPVPLPQGKKLIMKDGTFQIAREYSVEGDRVRYYSVERSDWEEIPSSLVDWDATKKEEAEQKRKEEEQAEKNRQRVLQEETEGVADVDASLEVHPGLILPDGPGMFVLASRQFVALKQDQAISKIAVGREVEKTLSGVPTIPSKHRIELPGKRSALRFGTGDLEFFMRTADQREPRMTLVRAHAKGDARLVDTESSSVIMDTTNKADNVSTLLWEIAPGVYRFTIDQDLPPGEYAFVETTIDGIDLNVWDFGVDATKTDTHAADAPDAPEKP